jgi:hypothetical protein
MEQEANPMATKKTPKAVKTNGRGSKTTTVKPTPKKTAKKAPAAATPSTGATHYIRNLHSGAGGARVDLINDVRIHLEPRGRRGDMRLVTPEMTQDPMYQHNLGILFEEIPIDAGQDIIRKQQINQQNGPSTMDLLTNEYGKKYTQTRATVMPSFESQGVTVANLSGGADGKNTTGNVDVTRAVQPTDHFAAPQPLGPEQVQVPGSTPVFNPDILPAGISIEQAQVFIETPREQRLALVEQWRQQAMEAEAYRNELNVSYEPPEQV